MSRQFVSYRTDPIDEKDYDPSGANGGGEGLCGAMAAAIIA
jgi:hypothetical protein